jgi:6-phosphogluconolactonase (cycloisomerase 2 family)
VAAYTVADGGALEPLSVQPSGGAEPCHLAITDGHLLVANFGSGSVGVLPVAADGTLGPPTDVVRHTGVRPDPYPQEGPHAHHVSVSGDEVTVVDMGLDALYGYTLESGRLRPRWSAAAPAGSGPRHLAVHRDGRRFVSDELSSTVSTWVGLRRMASRPATMAAPAQRNYPAEIALDGGLLYVANRGGDVITVFDVDGGLLRPLGEAPSGGRWPRHFALAGRWLYVANQRSDAVSVLHARPLAPTGLAVPVAAPTCVLVWRA